MCMQDTNIDQYQVDTRTNKIALENWIFGWTGCWNWQRDNEQHLKLAGNKLEHNGNCNRLHTVVGGMVAGEEKGGEEAT